MCIGVTTSTGISNRDATSVCAYVCSMTEKSVSSRSFFSLLVFVCFFFFNSFQNLFISSIGSTRNHGGFYRMVITVVRIITVAMARPSLADTLYSNSYVLTLSTTAGQHSIGRARLGKIILNEIIYG